MMVVYRKGWVKIQQMYENLEFDLDLKLLFMVTGAYYESGLLYFHLEFYYNYVVVPKKYRNCLKTVHVIGNRTASQLPKREKRHSPFTRALPVRRHPGTCRLLSLPFTYVFFFDWCD